MRSFILRQFFNMANKSFVLHLTLMFWSYPYLLKEVIILFIFLLTTEILAQSYVDFGYDIIGATRRKLNGYTELTVVFRGPPDTETYWEIAGIPVIEFDRFSTSQTSKSNDIFTSTLQTTKDFGFAVFNSYSFRPTFVRTSAEFYNTKRRNTGIYYHGCSYRNPQHANYSVNLNFKCNTNKTFHADVSGYSVQNQSKLFERVVYYSNIGGQSFKFQSTNRNANEMISTLSARDMTKAKTTSLLALYSIHFEYRSNTGPVSDIRFQIEDDVDLNGVTSPLYGQNVFVTQFWFRPLPQAETRIGSIFCEAIGNPRPSVNIYKVGNNGESLTVNYPTQLFQTQYRTRKTLVINYPTEEDVGNFTCVARSNEKERTEWLKPMFEPPPRFDDNSTTKITNEAGEIVITVTVNGYYDFNVECYKNDIGGAKLNREVQSTSTESGKGLKTYQTTILTITFPPYPAPPGKIVCKAIDDWTGYSYYVVDI